LYWIGIAIDCICLHLKIEFRSCDRGRQWCGIFHCYWRTVWIKARLLFSSCWFCFLWSSLNSNRTKYACVLRWVCFTDLPTCCVWLWNFINIPFRTVNVGLRGKRDGDSHSAVNSGPGAIVCNTGFTRPFKHALRARDHSGHVLSYLLAYIFVTWHSGIGVCDLGLELRRDIDLYNTLVIFVRLISLHN